MYLDKFKDLAGVTRKEWLKMRSNSIGGSDCSAIMGLGLSEYESAYEVWLEKIGKGEEREENIPMFVGNELEPVILKWFSYWEDDETGRKMVENYRANKKVRECEKPEKMFYHKDHSFMHANLDGLTGDGAVVEVKTMTGYALKRWENGVPLNHVVQLQHNMEVVDADKGYLVIFSDNKLNVFEFRRDFDLCKQIVESCNLFWNKHVITKTPPPADSSQALDSYLKKHWSENVDNMTNIIQGTEEEWDLAYQREKTRTEIKELEKKKRLYDSTFRTKLIDKQAHVIDFEEGGKIEYRPRGESWTLSYKINSNLN